jgi:uncharacterized protein YlaI
MAQVKTWICDGCEKRTETAVDADISEFYQTKVSVGEWEGNFHLCSKCHDKLLDHMNPSKWPKFAAEKAA